MTGDESHTGHLSGSFDVSGAGALSFGELAHPDEKAVLEKSEEILKKIPKGQALLKAKKRYGIPVTVVSGKETTYTTPEDSAVLLMLSPFYEKEFELVVLAYGVALRDAEQSFAGFKRPPVDSDPAEYASMTFSKSLDIIMHLCIIADELKEELGFTKPLDLVHELGHGYIYKAYKENTDENELIDLFIEGENKAFEEGNKGE